MWRKAIYIEGWRADLQVWFRIARAYDLPNAYKKLAAVKDKARIRQGGKIFAQNDG